MKNFFEKALLESKTVCIHFDNMHNYQRLKFNIIIKNLILKFLNHLKKFYNYFLNYIMLYILIFTLS